MILEDENKMIVETETVKTTPQSILPVQLTASQVQIQEGNLMVSDTHQIQDDTINVSSVRSNKISESCKQTDPSQHTIPKLSHVASSKSTDEQKNIVSDLSLTEEHIRSYGDESQSSQQLPLISHNPLSTHISTTVLKNKKSSLLIDSLSPLGTGISLKESPPIASVLIKEYDQPVNETNETMEMGTVTTKLPLKDQDSIRLVTSSLEDCHADQDSLKKPKELATKADFFAARLATAVGENEISDSEETFVYESTANSTKNGYENSSTNLKLKSYGISSKLSVPLLNKNEKLLNRLKNTRHTSIAAIPSSNVDLQPFHKQESVHEDDLKSIKSIQRLTSQELQSVKSCKTSTTLPRSLTKHVSLASLTKGSNNHRPNRNIKKSSGNIRPPISLAPKRNSKTNPKSNRNGKQRILRTTSSKIFDANGSSLRRYSGVPDDINLEDYVEQINGTLTPHKFVYQSSLDLTSDIEEDEVGETDPEECDEEEDGLIYAGEDGDDVESMFYYRGDGVTRCDSNRFLRNNSHTQLLSDFNDNNHAINQQDTETVQYYQKNQRQFDFLFQSSELTPLKSTNLKRRPPATMYSSYYSPHNFYTKKDKWYRLRNFVHFTLVVIFLLTLGFISGFLLATNKELHKFDIMLIDDVLVSTEELVVDVTASAFNPTFFTITIQDTELDIFAKVPHSARDKKESGPPSYTTIMLGTVYSLETPMTFRGGFFNRNCDVSVSSIKLLHPGSMKESDDRHGIEAHKSMDRAYNITAYQNIVADTMDSLITMNDNDNNNKWKCIIRDKFDLIIRGNMMYNIPFFNTLKTVGIHKQITVDPNKSMGQLDL